MIKKDPFNHSFFTDTDRFIKRIIILKISLFILFMIGLFWIADLLEKASTKEQDGYKAHLNTKVVIQKDTLTVVDYSNFYSTYTLSNGTKISFELYNKVKINK